MEKVIAFIESGKAEGARLLCGGQRLTEGALARRAYVELRASSRGNT